MIEEKVECKRLGNEYKNLFERVIYFIHHTPFAKDYINDKELKMLSDLDLYLHTGKYEIIEFGTRTSPFDVTGALKEKDKEIQKIKIILEELENYLNNEINEWEYVDDTITRARVEEDKEILEKLKELTEGDTNDNK